ncbi:TolC family protein [Psychroflexus sp. CAK8W]|uniref:TolC family protein n=1 Tax=Psychroflexus longus TaxID=2873596 RepID=A0ABS7XER7_9FLAO|nr:TolC family protein [Psychroflexus longus]MBZ9777434.1 TolC family protein [Psychroflexus longus]
MRSKLVILLVLLTACLTAQEVRKDTLLNKNQAIELVLSKNFDIEVSENNLEIADNNQGILNSGYLPTLSTSFGYDFSLQDRLAEVEGREPINQNDLETRSYRASLDLNYTVFDGLGRLYNYKSLKEQYDLSELEVRETIENTLIQMFTVYYEVARIYENVQILEQTMEISNERVKRSNYQFQFGQNSKLVVLNAEVDAANDSINLINARQNLENTRRDLMLILNTEFEKEFKVDTLVNFIPELLIAQYIEKAEENNVSVLKIERNLTISDYDIKISRSGYFPQIDLFGSYGWNRNISPESPFFPGSTQTLEGLSAGVSLSWNLFDGGQTAVRVQNAKVGYKTQEVLKDQIKFQVKRDISNAFNNYKNRLYIFELQEQNVITNKNNFDRSKEQFSIGQITSIEFRQAQINLINAQTSRNLAKYDAKIAELQLLQLTGQLLNIDF